jgi:hypothetical protein
MDSQTFPIWNPLDFLYNGIASPEPVNPKANPVPTLAELEELKAHIGITPMESCVSVGDSTPPCTKAQQGDPPEGGSLCRGDDGATDISPSTPPGLAGSEEDKETDLEGGLGFRLNPCSASQCVHIGCLLKLRPGLAGNGSLKRSRLETGNTASTITPLRVVAELHTSRFSPCGEFG